MRKQRNKWLALSSVCCLGFSLVTGPILTVHAVTQPMEKAAVETSQDLPNSQQLLAQAETTEENRYFFQRSRVQGVTGESIKVTLVSQQAVAKITFTVPAAGEIVTEELPVGLSVHGTEDPQVKEVVSSTPRNTFVLPVSFSESGSYTVEAQDKETTIEVQEAVTKPAEESTQDSEATTPQEPDRSEAGDNETDTVDPEMAGEDESKNEPLLNEENTEKNNQEEAADESAKTQTDFVGETAEVNTFEELRLAVANPEVSKIEVRANLSRTNTNANTAIGTLDRDLLINGNGHTINFGGGTTVALDNGSLILAELEEGQQATLRVENATLAKTNTIALFNAAETGAGWELQLENITEGTANAAGRWINIPEGSVVFTGGTSQFTRVLTGTFIIAKKIEFNNNSEVTISRGSTNYFFSSASVDNPSVTVRENSKVTMAKAVGTSNPIALRGDNAKLVIEDNSSLELSSIGTNDVAATTSNNAISMTGTNPTISVTENSSLRVTTTNAKRGIHLAGSNATVNVDNATLSITTVSGNGLDLSGERPVFRLNDSELAIRSTTGRRIGLVGVNSKVDLTNSQVDLVATTGQGIYLQDDAPQLLVSKSKVNINDTGASNAITLQGTDALMDLSSQSALTVTGAGTGTTQNIVIGNNNARPTMNVSDGSTVSLTTPSATSAAGDAANNGIHLRGETPKLSVTKNSELNVTVSSGARRGIWLNGNDSSFTVDNSNLAVETLTGQGINQTGTKPDLTMNQVEAEVKATSGQRISLVGAEPTIDLKNSQLAMTASTGRGIYLQGTTPQVLLDASELELTDTGATQGMILQGTDALLSLDNKSRFEVAGGGTGTLENIQIGNNNARPSLKVNNESLLSVVTSSATSGATETANNAVHLRGASPNVAISNSSEVAVGVTSGARAGLVLTGQNPEVRMTDGSEVTLTGLTGTNLLLKGDNAVLEVLKQATLKTVVGDGNSVLLDGLNPILRVSGNGTKLDASSHRMTDVEVTATVIVGPDDANIRNPSYLMEVTDHAEFNLSANLSSALRLSGNNGICRVSNNGVFDLSNGNTSGLATEGGNANATIRFTRSGTAAEAGGNLFEIDQGEMRIKKSGGNAPAVRMFGSNNRISVINQGKFSIDNPGNGTPHDGNAGGGNQAIHYTSGTNNSFYVSDQGSSIILNADNGPAIDMAQNGSIVAENGSYFSAVGRTATANGAIFRGQVLDISLDNPLFMDFRNTRTGGGRLFAAAAGSNLKGVNSDLALWRLGTDLEDAPTFSFSTQDFAFSGANFQTLTSTSKPEELNTSVIGTTGLAQFSRLSSNNARWTIADELHLPTDADKHVYGRVSIPVGLYDNRPAWTDEVEVTIEVERVDGTKQTFSGNTVGHSAEEPGISIYGAEPRGGLFKIALDKHLQAGDKVRIVSAEQLDIDSSDSSNSFENINLTDTLETVPVTPPVPAKFSSTIIPEIAREIHGHSENQEVTVEVTYNGQAIDTSDVVVDKEGNFTISISDLPLKEDDEIQVFLRDKKGSAEEAGVIDPPTTNNQQGNINPSERYDYHDKTFEAATILTVVGQVSPADPLDPEKEIDPDDSPEIPIGQGLLSLDFVSQFRFGQQRISAQDRSYYAQPQRILDGNGQILEDEERPNYVQVSDRRGIDGGWELMVTQNHQFMADGEKELAGAAVVFHNQEVASAASTPAPLMVNRNTTTLIPGNATPLMKATNGRDDGQGTWLYRFGDGDTANESVELFVPKSATPDTDYYQTTFTWMLQSVPE